MELRQLATFIRVAQFKSFSRAAESLGYSQSAVTVQIRQLEEELDTRLFDRMGKRIALTDTGERFLSHALRCDESGQSGAHVGHIYGRAARFAAYRHD